MTVHRRPRRASNFSNSPAAAPQTKFRTSTPKVAAVAIQMRLLVHPRKTRHRRRPSQIVAAFLVDQESLAHVSTRRIQIRRRSNRIKPAARLQTHFCSSLGARGITSLEEAVICPMLPINRWSRSLSSQLWSFHAKLSHCTRMRYSFLISTQAQKEQAVRSPS